MDDILLIIFFILLGIITFVNLYILLNEYLTYVYFSLAGNIKVSILEYLNGVPTISSTVSGTFKVFVVTIKYLKASLFIVFKPSFNFTPVINPVQLPNA